MNCSMQRLKVTFVIFCTTFLLVPKFALSASIEESVARTVAENFLQHLNASQDVASIETVQSSGEDVGYLVSLSSGGYILVAANDIRVPIKGYSLNSQFSTLPPLYRTNLLKELEVPAFSLSRKTASSSKDLAHFR